MQAISCEIETASNGPQHASAIAIDLDHVVLDSPLAGKDCYRRTFPFLCLPLYSATVHSYKFVKEIGRAHV